MYGAGDGGRAGWPVQAAEVDAQDWTFLDRLPPSEDEPVPYDEPERDAQRIVDALGTGSHLVAHSGGAVPALLAAARAPGSVRSLTLFEPACLSVARGRPAVDGMVAAMAPVFARAGDPGLSDVEFTHQFMLAMGTPGADPSDSETEVVGRRLRLMTPPWETPLPAATAGEVPTLVVTGAWNAAFDEIAEVFVEAGAHHVVVPGSGHGPQYHPDGHAAMVDFQRGA